MFQMLAVYWASIVPTRMRPHKWDDLSWFDVSSQFLRDNSATRPFLFFTGGA
jgi:hypothetical protein